MWPNGELFTILQSMGGIPTIPNCRFMVMATTWLWFPKGFPQNIYSTLQLQNVLAMSLGSHDASHGFHMVSCQFQTPMWLRHQLQEVLASALTSRGADDLERAASWAMVRTPGWWSVRGWKKAQETYHWGFPEMGVPQNRRFKTENPIKMDAFGVPPFRETTMYIIHFLAL